MRDGELLPRLQNIAAAVIAQQTCELCTGYSISREPFKRLLLHKNVEDAIWHTALLKIWATETYTKISSELVRIADEDGARVGKLHLHGDDEVAPLASLLNASVTTIYGGSNEIQRNILAKRVLGLPT